ncbi:MAG: hypothetical protein WBW16_05810 [Bacteroidota bacterium]
MKLLVVGGTGLEIIKLAPVLLLAKELQGEGLSVTFCHTGQHESMAQEAMSIFDLSPNIDLEIMKPNQSMNLMICRRSFQQSGRLTFSLRHIEGSFGEGTANIWRAIRRESYNAKSF